MVLKIIVVDVTIVGGVVVHDIIDVIVVVVVATVIVVVGHRMWVRKGGVEAILRGGGVKKG